MSNRLSFCPLHTLQPLVVGSSSAPNAAPEWQAGSLRWRGAGRSWWPVHPRGLFEVSRLCRQHLQTFASAAEALSFKE